MIVVKLQQNTTGVDTHWCRPQLLRLPDIHPRPGAHWLVRYNCQGFHVLISSGGFDIPELLLIVTTDGNKIRDWPFFIRDAPSTPLPVRNLFFMRNKNEIISVFTRQIPIDNFLQSLPNFLVKNGVDRWFNFYIFYIKTFFLENNNDKKNPLKAKWSVPTQIYIIEQIVWETIFTDI